MQTTSILIYDATLLNGNHYFAVSPNEQIIVNWVDSSTPIKIFNFTQKSISMILKNHENFYTLNPESKAIFTNDSSEIFFAIKGGFLYQQVHNGYTPAKRVILYGIPTKTVVLLNEAERIFLLIANNQRNVIYHESINQSVSVPAFINQKTTIISQDKKYLLQFSSSQLQINKITCTTGYFYDAQTSFCRPCWVNNCSTCDSDTGKCLSCIDNTLYYTADGICSQCSKYCLTCENITGNCIECQPPYQINSKFECDTESEVKINVFQIIISTIQTTKIYGTTLLFSFINQFQLYNYHNREYGNRTLLYITPINIFQLSKLSFLSQQNSDQVLSSLKRSSSYKNYTKNIKFIYQTDLDYNFWNASFIFFVQTIPQSFMFYILIRMIFMLLFNYEVSRFIRPYSFYLFYLPCIFANHIEYLTYTIGNQLQSMIQNAFMLVLNVFFVLLMYIVVFPFLIFIFHKKTKKYFFDQCFPTLVGAVAINIFTTYKAFILSLIQSFMFQKYLLQMASMIGVQITVIILLLFIQKKWNCFERQSTFIFILIHQFLMVLMNSMLMIDFHYRQKNDLETLKITDIGVEVIIWFISINILINTIIFLLPLKKNKKTDSQKTAKNSHQSKSTKRPISVLVINKMQRTYGTNSDFEQEALSLQQNTININKFESNKDTNHIQNSTQSKKIQTRQKQVIKSQNINKIKQDQNNNGLQSKIKKKKIIYKQISDKNKFLVIESKQKQQENLDIEQILLLIILFEMQSIQKSI